jgi:hypothetical protein
MNPAEGLDTQFYFLFTLCAQRLNSVWRVEPLSLLQSVGRIEYADLRISL